MSQWLTSGRNRLLAKQKERQRFGISNNQTQDHHTALHRELPSAAVSSELIQSSADQPGIHAQRPQQTMNFPDQNTTRLSLSEQLQLQEQIQQQKANLILQQLHYYRREQQIAELAHLHRPEMQTNAEVNDARFQNQLNLPLMLQRNKHLHGSNPSHLVGAEAQNEFRNILELQDMLHRQLLQRKIDEEILLANQQQALALELERQEQIQRNANAQLLSQFVNIEQLAARQELLSRSLIGHHGVPNVRNPSTTIEGISEILRLNALGAAPSNQPFSLNNQRNQLDALSRLINQGNRQGPSSEAIDVQSLGFQSLDAATNRVAPMMGQSPGIGNILEEMILKESAKSNQTPDNLLPQESGVMMDATNSSNVSIRTIDPTNLPNIRYFNSGQEVDVHGQKIETKDEDAKVNKKKEDKSKKRKLLEKIEKMSKEQGSIVTSGPRSISKFQAQRKLPLTKGVATKLPTKHDKLLKSKVSERSNNVKTDGKKKVNGPHHDLMLEFFPSAGSEEDKKNNGLDKMSVATGSDDKKTNKEEDKMSAANALLGFKQLN